MLVASASIFLIILAETAQPQEIRSTADKLPQFASLKASPADVRTGPGRQYPKRWVFRRAGLPVEIIQTYKTWRRIRDVEGTSGWVSQHLLSRRRTALVMPWDANKPSKQPVYVALRSSARTGAETIARLEAGALVNVKYCNGKWCFVTIRHFAGYIFQKKLWGVYLSEEIS
ncbi:MAG: hypothetical protein HRT83_01105 [Hyphomicrobiaceae bacterium]|nr:hypothetical protein [Hyphomicrobiaceae bacterium]